MDRNSDEYALMRDKALAQLRSGESLTGKDGAFGPLFRKLNSCPNIGCPVKCVFLFRSYI